MAHQKAQIEMPMTKCKVAQQFELQLKLAKQQSPQSKRHMQVVQNCSGLFEQQMLMFSEGQGHMAVVL